jgi:hypothetical protein
LVLLRRGLLDVLLRNMLLLLNLLLLCLLLLLG